MKLPERKFKPGDRVWSIRSGFVTLVVNKDKYTDKQYNLKCDKGSRYNENGFDEYNHAHRTLFSLDEAKNLFGVDESEQKKVLRWKYIVKTNKDHHPPFETGGYFKNDMELESYFSGGVRWFKRIEESMREFEE